MRANVEIRCDCCASVNVVAWVFPFVLSALGLSFVYLLPMDYFVVMPVDKPHG